MPVAGEWRAVAGEDGRQRTEDGERTICAPRAPRLRVRPDRVRLRKGLTRRRRGRGGRSVCRRDRCRSVSIGGQCFRSAAVGDSRAPRRPRGRQKAWLSTKRHEDPWKQAYPIWAFWCLFVAMDWRRSRARPSRFSLRHDGLTAIATTEPAGQRRKETEGCMWRLATRPTSIARSAWPASCRLLHEFPTGGAEGPRTRRISPPGLIGPGSAQRGRSVADVSVR